MVFENAIIDQIEFQNRKIRGPEHCPSSQSMTATQIRRMGKKHTIQTKSDLLSEGAHRYWVH